MKDEEGQILGQIELCLHDRFVVKKWRDKKWYFGYILTHLDDSAVKLTSKLMLTLKLFAVLKLTSL